MKLFYFYTDFFADMLQVFTDSMKDNWDIYPVSTENFNGVEVAGGRSGDLMRKLVIDYALSKTKNDEIFIVSDIDIYFYKPCIPYLNKAFDDKQKLQINNTVTYKNLDILFQKEFLYRDCNMGFMAMKNNDKVKSFWEEVYSVVLDKKIWDQPYMNKVLYSNIVSKTDEFSEYKDNNKIVWHTFDKNIWNLTLNKNPNSYASLDIMLHHANCTKYKLEKLKQMSWIKNILINKAVDKYISEYNIIDIPDRSCYEAIASDKYLEYGCSANKKINDIKYI